MAAQNKNKKEERKKERKKERSNRGLEEGKTKLAMIN